MAIRTYCAIIILSAGRKVLNAENPVSRLGKNGTEEVNDMKKSYQVFYVIKRNGKEELNHMSVMANNQREAIKQCKAVVFEKTGRNAFRATTKAPCETKTAN